MPFSDLHSPPTSVRTTAGTTSCCSRSRSPTSRSSRRFTNGRFGPSNKFWARTLASFLVLKYAVLTATAGLVFVIVRRMTGDALWGLLTVEALALVYQISWRLHEGFTSTIGAMFLVVAAFYALTRVLDRGRLADFALFGAAAGAAMLTSFSVWWTLASLLIAALLTPNVRDRLFLPALGLSILIAGLIVAPFVIWVTSDPLRRAELVALPGEIAALPYATRAVRGLIEAVRGPIFFLSPLCFMLPLFFPRMLTAWRSLARDAEVNDAGRDLERLLGTTTLIMWVLLAVALTVQGVPELPMHALIPNFVLTILWLMAKARRACTGSSQITTFTIVAASIAVVAFVARAANLIVLDPVCSTCRWAIPFDQLAAGIRAQGFERGTIVAVDNHVAGNLRRFFPDDRIVNAAAGYVPPMTPRARGGQIAVVWEPNLPRMRLLWAGETYVGREVLPLLDRPRVVRGAWHHLWRPAGYRHSEWHMVLLDRRQ